MKIIIMMIGLLICSAQALASPSSKVQSDGYNGLQGASVLAAARALPVRQRLQLVRESLSPQTIGDLIAVVSYLAGTGYMVYGAAELISGNNPLTSFIVGAGLLSAPTLFWLAVSADDFDY